MASIPIGKRDKAVPEEPAVEVLGSGKGRPTPTRREKEAANLRPLVQTDRKAAGKQSRARSAETRERARLGLAAGEERYLPIRDRGMQRRYVRDYVDARYSVGEFLLPVMFLFILVSLVPSIAAPAILAIYAFILIAVIDAIVLGLLVTRRLRAKLGEGNVDRGHRWYAAMRALQLRPMRLPKPQVKRGAFPS
jgi:hypothetical protein